MSSRSASTQRSSASRSARSCSSSSRTTRGRCISWSRADGRLVAGGQLGAELDDPVLERVDGAILGQVGEHADGGGEDQVLAGRPLQDVLEPVLERLVAPRG